MEKEILDPRTHTKPHEKELTHFLPWVEVEGRLLTLSGASFVHRSCRLTTNAFLVLLRRPDRADGLPGKTEDRAAVLEDYLQPRTLIHLWEVDAAEEQSHNEVYRAITDRVITKLVNHLQVPLRTI